MQAVADLAHHIQPCGDLIGPQVALLLQPQHPAGIDPLPRYQQRDPRGVGADRLGGDRPDGLLQREAVPLGSPGLTQRPFRCGQ